MLDTYQLNICGLKRDLPLIRIGDDFAFARFVTLGDTELIEKAAEAIISHPDFPTYNIDILACLDAKAVPLTHAIARRLKVNYVVAKKTINPYTIDQVVETIESITDAENQVLVLEAAEAKAIEGRNVCLVDDVVSTGLSLKGLENLVAKARCKVVCKAAILLEDTDYIAEDLIYLEKLPVFKD